MSPRHSDPGFSVESTSESINLYVDAELVGRVLIFDSVTDLNKALRSTPHSPFNVEIQGAVGWLPVIELSPNLRGRGIGSGLLKEMFEEAEHRGLSALFLHAGDPFGHSGWRQEQFWSRLGFERLRYDDGTYWSQPMILVLWGRRDAPPKSQRVGAAPSPSDLDPANIKTRAVAGSAYKTNDIRSTLTHAVNQTTGKPLCNRVKPENLLDDPYAVDDEDAPATCPLCAKRDPRFNHDHPEPSPPDQTALNVGDRFLLQYGNGTQVARVRALMRTGYAIDRMVAVSVQGYTGDKPTHVVRGFEWRPVTSPVKTTDPRILGPVPQNDPRRRSPAFVIDSYEFCANAGEPSIRA